MNFIEKLNNIDIKDLQKIDYNKLLQDFRKKPEMMAVAVLIVGTLFFCLQYFSAHQQRLSSMRSQIALLQKKTKAIASLKDTRNAMNTFLKNLPQKITENALIDKITNLAGQSHVQIESFSPAKSADKKIYKEIQILITISSPTYKNLWLFVHHLEETKNAIRIDHLTARMDERGGGFGQRPQISSASRITMQLQISAIDFENAKP